VSSWVANAVALIATLPWCLAAELALAEEVEALAARAPLESFAGVWPMVARALSTAEVGRVDEARVRLDAAAPRLPEAERDSEWLPMMAQVAEVIGHVGPHPVAAYVYESLLPFRALFVVEGIGAAMRGSVERHLGIAAAALGRRDAAAEHFDAASPPTNVWGRTSWWHGHCATRAWPSATRTGWARRGRGMRASAPSVGSRR
jgi:hypothetical protein